MIKLQDEFSEYRGFDDRGWICDTCHQIIEKGEDGWVQWRRPRDRVLEKLEMSKWPICQDLQLVHHVPASPLPKKRGELYGCQFDDHEPGFIVSDLSLSRFLGPDGLMTLLSFIAENGVQQDEVLEMIKRLHVPGYEHARLHFEEAIGEGVFEPNRLEGYYWQSNIRAVTKWLNERD